MAKLGFRHFGFLGYFRVTREFVQVVSVWRGRGAGAFYLANFVNLLSSPRTNYLTAYKVGSRPARNPDTGVQWNVADESELEHMFQDMLNYIHNRSLALFTEMSLTRFVAEIDQRGSMFNQAKAVALGLLGRQEEIPALLDEDERRLTDKAQFHSKEHAVRVRQVAAILRKASISKEAFACQVEYRRSAALREIESEAS